MVEDIEQAVSTGMTAAFSRKIGDWSREAAEDACWSAVSTFCHLIAQKQGLETHFLEKEIEHLKAQIEPEIVICSAIRLSDGRIFRGQRHCHCINLAYDLVTHQKESGYSTLEWECPDGDDQGFISSKNRYVTREEGLALQKAAGIESVAEGGYRGSILFSKDLY